MSIWLGAHAAVEKGTTTFEGRRTLSLFPLIWCTDQTTLTKDFYTGNQAVLVTNQPCAGGTCE